MAQIYIGHLTKLGLIPFSVSNVKLSKCQTLEWQNFEKTNSVNIFLQTPDIQTCTCVVNTQGAIFMQDYSQTSKYHQQM